MTISRLLVVRNDRLGDFMLAWPALSLLRERLPDAEITLLARRYTEPLARICPYVDKVVIDPEKTGELANGWAIKRRLQQRNFEASLSLFSRFDSALGLWLARIPIRAAPATKLAQIFYTQSLRQRRSQSIKPEYRYNMELAAWFLASLGVDAAVSCPRRPLLNFPGEEIGAIRRNLCAHYGFSEGQPLVLVHPGHGGSATHLSERGYARLLKRLNRAGVSIILTAGPSDLERTYKVSELAGPIPVLESRQGLVQFAKTLAASDVFISGSTGPLHIAGALNRHTAAFYPRRRSASAIRWQSLSEPHRRLAWMPPPEAAESDLDAIDLDAAADMIIDRFLGASDHVGESRDPHTLPRSNGRKA